MGDTDIWARIYELNVLIEHEDDVLVRLDLIQELVNLRETIEEDLRTYYE